jgi:hypothetical protein
MKTEPVWQDLRTISFKLKTIGYFIENQKLNEVIPEDFEDIQWGLSLMIREMSQEIRRVSQNLEKTELRHKARSKR